MRILITGKGGKAGSWQIRGEQIGKALGARVIPIADDADLRWADVVIVVKRCPDPLLERIRRSGKPWVYDIVDAYPQPACAAWDHWRACQWLNDWLNHLHPTAVIWPTEMMRLDGPRMRGAVIPHHHREGIAVNPIRERIEKVGYEGAQVYIEGWRAAIEKVCAAIGAQFIVNPERLADVDVVLAVRDQHHDGYPHRMWKSNVKLANAQGSGTPVICAREAGYVETRSGGELWIDSKRDLIDALPGMQSQVLREIASDCLRVGAPTIDRVAAQYRELLCNLK